MIELVSIVAILAISGAVSTVAIFYAHKTHEQNIKLINALIAKTPKEFAELTLADNVKIETTKPQEPEFVSTDQVGDDEYIKAVTS